jgi:hypothetical protein
MATTVGLLHPGEMGAGIGASVREGAALRTAPKAWRFVGEMDEIASTFAAADLPEGFHRAAGEVYTPASPT